MKKSFFLTLFMVMMVFATATHAITTNVKVKEADAITLDTGTHKWKNHFLITLYSNRAISAHRLKVNSDYSMVTADDSIIINADSIQSVFYDKPGTPAPATVAGILIGTTVGLFVGAITSEAILVGSSDPYFGENGVAAAFALVAIFSSGMIAGTLVGHHIGSDKMYSFDNASAERKKELLKHLQHIKIR